MSAALAPDNRCLDLVERVGRAGDLAAAGAALLEGLKPCGALAIVSNIVPLLPGAEDRRDLKLQPAGFIGSAAEAAVDAHNPNPAHLRRVRSGFRWRDVAIADRRACRTYWEAAASFSVADGLVVPLYDRRRLYVVSIALADRALPAAADRLTATFAAHAFLQRARDLMPEPPPPAKLSPRERDCMGFVTEGKTDWEISVILGLSQHTAHEYVESARRKLGGRTRAGAAARFMLSHPSGECGDER